MQTIEPHDARLSWDGAVSLERTGQYVSPWRIPFEKKSLFDPSLAGSAATAAGVRLGFFSDTPTLAVHYMPPDNPKSLDLFCNGNWVATAPLQRRDRVIFDNLPAGRKRVELWLPVNLEFRLTGLEIADGAELARFTNDRPRWIAYGSSITQASDAASPSLTWPAIVARAMDVNLTSLGFGGQCHLDSMIALLIRDLPADYISICAGINILGGASLGPRTFKPALIGAVTIIREKHPSAPLTLQSPIFGCQRETQPNVLGFTLPRMREEVRSAVNILRDSGDPNIHYVDGLEILGEADQHLLPDQLHPNADGYRLMGKNFLAKVATRLWPDHHPS